ncbi:MAG: HAD family hydrolase [Chloroflexota bacterium]
MDPILFDWDGTLADTLDAIYEANVAVMTGLDLPFDKDLYRRHFAPDWRVMYGRLGVPDDRLEEANASWWAALDHDDTQLFPGVREALQRLATAGYPLAIVTAGRSDRVGAELRRLGVESMFGAIVYGDDFLTQKPDPAPFRAALERLGLADRIATSRYVGDTPDDMRMAVAAGARGIGIESVLGDASDLRTAGAQETAASMVEWVDRLLAEPTPDRVVAPRAPAPG